MELLFLFWWSATSLDFTHCSYLAEVFGATLRGFLPTDLSRSGCDKLIGNWLATMGTEEGIVFWFSHETIIARLAEKSRTNPEINILDRGPTNE